YDKEIDIVDVKRKREEQTKKELEEVLTRTQHLITQIIDLKQYLKKTMK
ncbi:4317_t:CDS:1, partial [Scutellospora calospora]